MTIADILTRGRISRNENSRAYHQGFMPLESKLTHRPQKNKFQSNKNVNRISLESQDGVKRQESLVTLRTSRSSTMHNFKFILIARSMFDSFHQWEQAPYILENFCIFMTSFGVCQDMSSHLYWCIYITSYVLCGGVEINHVQAENSIQLWFLKSAMCRKLE